ncbi:MAG: hypothetical protein IKK94_01120 [Clostridia bacterium]|nr:hypothetical protein [Clostridia bacterium]
MTSLLINATAPCAERILSGKKTSLLMVSDPGLSAPFRIYLYDASKNLIVAEFFCSCINRWRTCKGLPDHLIRRACLNPEEIPFFCGDNDYLYELYISKLFIYGEKITLKDFGLEEPPKSSMFVKTMHFSNGFDNYHNLRHKDKTCKSCIHYLSGCTKGDEYLLCAHHDDEKDYLKLAAHVGDIVYCDFEYEYPNGEKRERRVRSLLQSHVIKYDDDGTPKIYYKVQGVMEPVSFVSHFPMYADPRHSKPMDYEDFLA